LVKLFCFVIIFYVGQSYSDWKSHKIHTCSARVELSTIFIQYASF